jgi:hypothetical protein
LPIYKGNCPRSSFKHSFIEILSPAFSYLRDGNTTTIPADYRPGGYKPEPFRVRVDTAAQVQQQGRDTLRQINDLTAQIASLNRQIDTLRGRGASPNVLLDQRDQRVHADVQRLGEVGAARAVVRVGQGGATGVGD